MVINYKMMRIKLEPDRREDWTCFFCCHVRTATICLGVWQLMLQIMALTTLAVVVRHPELTDQPMRGTDSVTPGEDGMDTPLPTPLSTTNQYTRKYSGDTNMSTQISLVVFASSLALIYGASKGKPFYLLPFFCLKVFDFCITCVIAISYLCALPSLHLLAQQAGPEVVRRHLHELSPATLGVVALLAFITALSIKAYLLSIIWRCYRFLNLRRVSGRATVSVLGTSGLAELGPDYDLHPAAASTSSAAAAGISRGPASTVALLNPPEYSKLKDLPPPPPPPPETPPPPYSSTLNLNRTEN
ncbi:hypothetical protein B566_EDAN001533 [Ephemera danica]|nr:hypothetical protein B566_EDAN001533 [Ephemera danica]